MTRDEADRIMAYRIARMVAREARRDACAFESAAYWHHHDKAKEWQYRAEQLMPRSARSVAPHHFRNT